MDACSSNFLIQDGIGKFDGFHAEILKETIQWDGHIINNAWVTEHRQLRLQIRWRPTI